MCRNPVGEGAKRVTTGLCLHLSIFLHLRSGALSSQTYVAMQWTSAPNIGEAPLPQRARSYWKARFSAAGGGLEKLLERERAQLPPWFVVGFGAGIAAWFALDGAANGWRSCASPPARPCSASAGGAARAGRALGWFALAATLGCGLVWARSAWVAQPRLDRPQVTQFTASVASVDYLAARQSVRLLLKPPNGALPPLVRVSIDDDKFPAGIAAGAEIQLRARLAPPPPMALPGTYDFARDAWFRGIGAVGKTLGPVTVLRPARPHGLDRARDGLRRHIAGSLPQASAGIAIALATGDQNAVDEDDADAMRRSGLTHLLSVSGLHIAAVVAFAMFLTLKLLALSETLALRFNLVLVAAASAAAAGIGYTLLTGAQVPTVRSCVAARADPRRHRARPRRDQHPPDRRRRAGGAAVPARSPRRAELPDELRGGDRDRRLAFDRPGRAVCSSAATKGWWGGSDAPCWRWSRPGWWSKSPSSPWRCSISTAPGSTASAPTSSRFP